MNAKGASREVAIVLLTGVLAGGGVAVLFLLASYRARADLCIVAGVAIAAVWRLARATATPDSPPPPPPPEEAETGQGFREVTSLAQRLSWGSVDRDRYQERVRPMLAELTAERLRTRRGIDARQQPDQARRIVGEALWELMTGPPACRCPTGPELSRLVADMERI